MVIDEISYAKFSCTQQRQCEWVTVFLMQEMCR